MNAVVEQRGLLFQRFQRRELCVTPRRQSCPDGLGIGRHADP